MAGQHTVNVRRFALSRNLTPNFDEFQVRKRSIQVVLLFLWTGVVLAGLLLAQAVIRQNAELFVGIADDKRATIEYVGAVTLLDVKTSVTLLFAFIGLLIARSEYEANHLPDLSFSNLLKRESAGLQPSPDSHVREVTLLNHGSGRAVLGSVRFLVRPRDIPDGNLPSYLSHGQAVDELARLGMIEGDDFRLLRLA